MRTRNHRVVGTRWPFVLWNVAAAALALLLLAGCGQPEPAAPEATPLPQAKATPDQSVQRSAWQQGPHADTYDLEKGPNTYCARCHSPPNWDPAARVDEPPNCVSCKFPFEDEPRIAAGSPLVPEEVWAGIGCQQCHRPENGFVRPEIAWFDSSTTYYETVADASELCERCHLDTAVLRHKRDLGETAHVDFLCTDCHDPHQATANCAACHPARLSGQPNFIPEHQDVSGNHECDECHAGIWGSHDMEFQQNGDDNCMGCHGPIMGHATIPPIQFGHSELHRAVACVACHDAAGLALEPLEDERLWMPFRQTEFLGRISSAPYQSHSLSRAVDCERCHFAGNPWELNELSEPLSEPEAVKPSRLGRQGTSGEEDPLVTIDWPNEGETIYAGPSSLVFRTPVRGRVFSRRFSPAALTLQLAVYHHDSLVGTLDTVPNAGGEYEFELTANPLGPEEQFEIAFMECAYACHSAGQLALQPGSLTAEVTATRPDGFQVTASRQFVLDVAGTATVTVQVELAGQPGRELPDSIGQDLGGIPVSASTWLYMWRARYRSGVTDQEGFASLQVEALGQAPTEYLLEVEPAVVGGVLYRGTAPVRLVIPAGASSVDPVTISVTAESGEITGQVGGFQGQPRELWAVRLPEGTAETTELSAAGEFHFSGLPLGRYLVTLDDEQLALAGYRAGAQHVDLIEEPARSFTIRLEELSGGVVVGRLADEEGRLLPFGWVSSGGEARAIMPQDGRYWLAGLPAGRARLVAGAPGFYSQELVLEPGVGEPARANFALRPRPETETYPWGEGHVLLPAGAAVEERAGLLELTRGHLFGESETAKTLTVQTPTGRVTIIGGRFALEYLPGLRGWLYLFQGQASVSRADLPAPLEVAAGQMVNLLDGDGLAAVPMEPAVIAALQADELSEEPVWEPSPAARVSRQLGRLGVGAAQAVTLATYAVAFLLLFLAPLLALFRWHRNRASG